jgi:hypothetical protein
MIISLGFVPPTRSSTPSPTPDLPLSTASVPCHGLALDGTAMRLLGRRFGRMLLAALPERYRRGVGATTRIAF